MIKNHFFGVVHGAAPLQDPNCPGSSRFEDGAVFFEASRISAESCTALPLLNDTGRQVVCCLLGYILNLEELRRKYHTGMIPDVELISRLYAEKGEDFLFELDGTFRIVLYDRAKQRVLILADSFGFVLPFYVCRQGNTFILSTSLKRLLSYARLAPGLNRSALYDFLFAKKCIPSGHTLIRQVQKIPDGYCLDIDLSKWSAAALRIPWKTRTISQEEAKRDLLSRIRHNVNCLLPVTGREVACTVTSGYDTNIILHYLCEIRSRQVYTYTIGGKDKDETSQVLKNVVNYPGITPRIAHVPEKKLDQLPDLVWKLEGYLFEGGIYLTDHLGSLLASQGERFVFTGEGGDGLFSSYQHAFIMNGRLDLVSSFPGYIYYRFIRPLFHLGSAEEQLLKKFRLRSYTAQFDKVRDMNLKKMGIILNEYGVMGLHPFLSFDYRSYCQALGRRLSRKKIYYKQEIRKTVHPQIAETLVKIGGSTDIGYLLMPQLRYLSPLLSSPLISSLFTERERSRIRRHPGKYITLIHHLFFLYTFDKLFLSGKFDLSRESPGVTLGELFR